MRSSVPCSGRALREDSFLSAKSQGELPKSLSRGTRVLRGWSARYYLGPDPIQRRVPHAGEDAMAHSNQRSSKRIGEAGRVRCGAFSSKAFKIRPRAFRDLHTSVVFIPCNRYILSFSSLVSVFIHECNRPRYSFGRNSAAIRLFFVCFVFALIPFQCQGTTDDTKQSRIASKLQLNTWLLLPLVSSWPATI